MLMLAMYPDLQERVYEECRSVSFADDEDITNESLAHLKYLDMFIKETLRMLPAVPFLTRATTSDVNVGSWHGRRLIPWITVYFESNVFVDLRRPNHPAGRWVGDQLHWHASVRAELQRPAHIRSGSLSDRGHRAASSVQLSAVQRRAAIVHWTAVRNERAENLHDLHDEELSPPDPDEVWRFKFSNEYHAESSQPTNDFNWKAMIRYLL